MSSPLLKVTNLSVTYTKPKKGTHLGTGAALNGATLEVRRGEIVGIVGETGSGKTTLARATVGLVSPAAGTIEFDGRDLGALRGRALRDFRRAGQVQLVFQDPLRSLDPSLRVREIVTEGLAIRGRVEPGLAEDALRQVELDPELLGRIPRDLSGGQRQRVSIARALITRPRLILLDEPVSALDAGTRGAVLAMLGRLRGPALVVISHDLTSLAGVADRVVVLYDGEIVEHGPTQRVLQAPEHDYTRLLLAAAPAAVRARVGAA
jgi:ABC-type glutathione transport system ATPase component